MRLMGAMEVSICHRAAVRCWGHTVPWVGMGDGSGHRVHRAGGRGNRTASVGGTLRGDHLTAASEMVSAVRG